MYRYSTPSQWIDEAAVHSPQGEASFPTTIPGIFYKHQIFEKLQYVTICYKGQRVDGAHSPRGQVSIPTTISGTPVLKGSR
jgi:hypothetical protein